MAARMTRDEKGAQVRAALLDAALAAFTEMSYEQVSVDEVAARAGLTKGAVYSRFGSKAELFRAAMTRDFVEDFDTNEVDTSPLLDESLSVDEQLKGLAASVLRSQERLNPSDLGALIAEAESGLAMVRNDRIRQQVRTGWRHAHDGFAQWTIYAAEREGCRLVIPAVDVATVVLSLIQGLSRMASLGALEVTQAGLETTLIGLVRAAFEPSPEGSAKRR